MFNIPHYSTLPPALKSVINTADYEGVLCPKRDDIFRAFYRHSLKDTKVIILGQEPYPVIGKSNGLAFGYHSDYKVKPDSSMLNIIKCLYNCYDKPLEDLTLESWAKQGVLLLNTRLTTIAGKAMGHANLGWEQVIIDFLKSLDKSVDNKVYLLWGKDTQSYSKHLDKDNNLILETSHPSSFSAHRGFLESECFIEANEYLERRNRTGIKWV